MKSFEEKASKIYDKKQKQERELEQYRTYLGLDKSEGKSSRIQPVIDDTMLFKRAYFRPDSKTKGRTEMSFYLTNPENSHY